MAPTPAAEPKPLDASAPRPAAKGAKDADVQIQTVDELVEFFTAAGKKGVAINRYKGLGEMNPDTLWATTISRHSSNRSGGSGSSVNESRKSTMQASASTGSKP